LQLLEECVCLVKKVWRHTDAKTAEDFELGALSVIVVRNR